MINFFPFGNLSSLALVFVSSFSVFVVSFFVLFVFRKNPKIAFFCWGAGFTAVVISEGVKLLIPSLRPFMIKGIIPLTLTFPSGNSFPSSHSAYLFSLSTMVFLMNMKAGIGILLVSLIIAFSRVVSHAHYPIDIVGGFILGVTVAMWLRDLLFKKLFPG